MFQHRIIPQDVNKYIRKIKYYHQRRNLETKDEIKCTTLSEQFHNPIEKKTIETETVT